MMTPLYTEDDSVFLQSGRGSIFISLLLSLIL